MKKAWMNISYFSFILFNLKNFSKMVTTLKKLLKKPLNTCSVVLAPVDYFVLRSYHVKTNQSIQTTSAKIWNDLPNKFKK